MKKALLILSLVMMFSIGLIPQAYAVDEVGDLWNPRRQGVTEEEGYVRPDKKVAYEGNASLRVYFKNAYKANTWVKLESSQNVSFDPDKTYLFECYAKSAGDGSKMYLGKLVWDWTSLGNVEVSGTDWTYFSKEFKPDTTANKFGIVIENPANGWIDNMSIRVLDEDGNPTGINYLENGGFESGDFTPPADVTEVDTESMDGAVLLSWRNPTDMDFTAVSVYEFNPEDDTETLVASVVPEGETSQAKIEGLENGRLYYFRIRARDNTWNESDGREIYGAPLADRFYTTPIVAAAGEEEIDALRSGEISFSTTVTNNRGGNDFTATLITAVYDGQRMTELQLSKSVIPENESADLQTVIHVPDSYGNLRVESYLWSDTDSMESLYQSKILAE